MTLCLMLASTSSSANDPAEATMPAGGHEHHHHLMAEATVKRTTAQYRLPDITVVRADGTRVNFAQEINDGQPVLLNFIFTTCTTICPVMSQTFAEVQKRLGPDAARIKMVSVSIDPEQDTPARLTEFASRYQAGRQWNFYTGDTQTSIAIERAFDLYRGYAVYDKMNHLPVTYFRGAPGQSWVRLDGFASPDALVGEVRAQIAQR